MSPSPTFPRAPSHLSRQSKAWWNKIVATWVIDDSMLPLLALAAGALDRCEQARTVLEKEGLLQRDRYNNPRPHPMLAVERDSRLSAARLVRELGLSENNESRPPRLGGRYK